MRIRTPERIDPAQLDIKDTVVSINRVTKVVKGGKNLSFAALVVIGRSELAKKIEKATARAQKRIEKQLKVDAKEFEKELEAESKVAR